MDNTQDRSNPMGGGGMPGGDPTQTPPTPGPAPVGDTSGGGFPPAQGPTTVGDVPGSTVPPVPEMPPPAPTGETTPTPMGEGTPTEMPPAGGGENPGGMPPSGGAPVA